MWMNNNSICGITMDNENNSTSAPRHSRYLAPAKPEVCTAFALRELTPVSHEHRDAIQSSRRERPDYTNLWFRVRRASFDQLLWQLIASDSIKRHHAYDAQNLPFWTVGIRVKVRNHMPLGRVMDALRGRMGVVCPGIRFCLDGFFGLRGFSDIFHSPDACPWMEISGFSTTVSLRLKDGDNIFISVATPAQVSDVNAWRRKRMLVPASRQAPEEAKDAGHTIIGSISYDNEDAQDLV